MNCEGNGHNPCPFDRRGSDVEFCQGDLWLCKDCLNARFSKSTRPNNNASENTANPLNDTCNNLFDENSLNHSQYSETYPKQAATNNINNTQANIKGSFPENVDCQNIIMDSLLSYTVSSLQACSPENVKRAVLGHFSHEEINKSKNVLWATCDNSIIGEKARRKDSVMRSENEAHLADIITALLKLDKTDKMPCIVIDAYSLHTIPRSKPEELNEISFADRLNQIESKFIALQGIVDRTVCENLVLKEKIEKLPLYSNVVRNTSPTSGSVPPQLISQPVIPAVVSQSSNNDTLNSGKHDSSIVSQTIPKSAVHDQNLESNNSRLNVPIDSRRGNSRGGSNSRRGLSRGGLRTGSQRGRPHPNFNNNFNDNYLPTGSIISLGKGSSMISLDQESVITTKSSMFNGQNKKDDEDGFSMPSHMLRRNRYKEKKRQKIITGCAQLNSGRFRGAPEPDRDLFIYRVDKSTGVSDLRSHITDYGFHIRGLECISNPDSKFKSFKLCVPMSEYSDLFSESLWPSGVRIRKFIPPRH